MLQIQLDKKKVDINSATNFSFDFGLKELFNMIGFSHADGMAVGKKMMDNKAIQIINDKIFIKNLKELARLNEYYKKMQQLEKARLEKKAQ